MLHPYVYENVLERDSCFRFHGVYIIKVLTQSAHTDKGVKSPWKRLFFLRRQTSQTFTGALLVHGSFTVKELLSQGGQVGEHIIGK